MNEIEQFFGSVVKAKKRDLDRDWQDIIFILCSEFGWTQKDIWESDIPFIDDVLAGRVRNIKKHNKDVKKANKRKR